MSSDEWIRAEKNMKKKLTVLTLCAMLYALCVSAETQQPTKVLRIGFLDTSTASGSAVLVEAFRQELSKLGWIEGKNITIEYRFAEQKPERLPELAGGPGSSQSRCNCGRRDVICVSRQEVTTTIPIVMANAGDPVGAGLVASLARPGGNVTGTRDFGLELNTKRLEILKDVVPKLARVGVLRTLQPQAETSN